MATRDNLARAAAVLGTLCAWFPTVFTLFTASIVTARTGVLHLDWMMPAELFLPALAGGLLLALAARRARARQTLILWGLVLMVVLLAGGQVLAIVTGLASGETQAGGWQWALVVASLFGYWAALLAVSVGGLLLVRDLYGKRPTS